MKNENETGYRLGIDIGGTNTELGIVDPQGNILRREVIPTVGYKDLDEYIRKIGEAYRKMRGSLREGSVVLGAGVGAPCANQSTGTIDGWTNLPYKGIIPLARLLTEELGIPTTISNDANVAGAGEHRFGAGRRIENFIMITLGTGVGGALVCDGHLLVGSRGFAAELGHVTLGTGFDRQCQCGRKGCLQTYTNAGGVVQTAKEILESDGTPSLLREIPGVELTPKLIAEAAEKGDSVAIETFRRTGEVLGHAVANFLAVTDPDAVILFGGVAQAGRLLTEPMREAMEHDALFLYKNRVRILTSELNGAEAALLGAAALVEGSKI